MGSVCIALDAMGGDFGPSVVVPAALEVLKQTSRLHLILVGKPDVLEKSLALAGQKRHPRIRLHPAEEVVAMDEPPAFALRHKRDSSMRVAIDLVKNGEAQACVSAGNTGALMAIARFVLKTIPGIDRPAIVYSLPTLTGHTQVLDLGANVDCQAEHLVQFAVMGSILASAVDNIPKPTVGLLNVGSEAIKGSEVVKKAGQLLKEAQQHNRINYIGFIEGDDIYKGTADVVVCDGFVGNVALKASEGILKMVMKIAKEEFMGYWYGRLAGLIATPVLRRLQKRLDPGQHNGATLVGLKGIVIKSHGGADINGFCAAIRVAVVEAQKNIPEKIQESVIAQLEDLKLS